MNFIYLYCLRSKSLLYGTVTLGSNFPKTSCLDFCWQMQLLVNFLWRKKKNTEYLIKFMHNIIQNNMIFFKENLKPPID